MNNDFKKNTYSNITTSYGDLDMDVSIQSMWSEFLLNQSNNLKVENKYFTSLRALKLFVQGN